MHAYIGSELRSIFFFVTFKKKKGGEFLFVPGWLENGSVATGSKQAQGGSVHVRAKSTLAGLVIHM
jgi:hypothetical protein